ncbi:MAG: hypothetical protein ACLQF1_21000 [Methyloceanibacter sp.]
MTALLWLRLRCWLANRFIDLSWLAWFFMAKGTAARLFGVAKRMVPQR